MLLEKEEIIYIDISSGHVTTVVSPFIGFAPFDETAVACIYLNIEVLAFGHTLSFPPKMSTVTFGLRNNILQKVPYQCLIRCSK